MKRQYVISIIAAFLATLGCNAQPRTINRTTVTTLDINRYMGKWYEIARFDHRFERNIEECQAFYSQLPDGTIRVVNSGISSKNGRYKSTVGKAKSGKQPGQLRVSFFWIFYADYNILALDDNYKWALVGSHSPKYLWILARSPHLDEATRQHIVEIARDRGYDTDELIWVRQL
ncbi:MAG: lipocalin family protein [Alistipes sp.]|nr:lipocalin family protein [Alistipes sp.]